MVSILNRRLRRLEEKRTASRGNRLVIVTAGETVAAAKKRAGFDPNGTCLIIQLDASDEGLLADESIASPR